MPDVVVTVPKNFRYDNKKGLAAWISEGDAAGDAPSGLLWEFNTGGTKPKIEPGDRVYVVCEGKLRGYAPLVELRFIPSDKSPHRGRISFIRGGDAVAVTIEKPIRGFQGWRYRWWERDDEMPFPDWKSP